HSSQDPPSTELYTLSLHDALPISPAKRDRSPAAPGDGSSCSGGTRSKQAFIRSPNSDRYRARPVLPLVSNATALRCSGRMRRTEDRKSTRLNSSHVAISYAVFCLK